MNPSETAKSTPGKNVAKGRSSPATRSKHRNSQRNLRKLRLLVGATQLQVAEKAGVTERCLRKVEQGKVKAQRETLAAIEGAIAILGRTAQAAALLLVVLCSSGCNERQTAAAATVCIACSLAVSVASFRLGRAKRRVLAYPTTTTNSSQQENELASAWFLEDWTAWIHGNRAARYMRLWREQWQLRIAEPKYQTTWLAVLWHGLRCPGPVRAYRMRWTGFAATQRRLRPLYAECQNCSWPAQPCDTAKQEPLPPPIAPVESAAPVLVDLQPGPNRTWLGVVSYPPRSKGDA